MNFTEVPNADLFDKARWWVPYAEKVARREGCEVEFFVSSALAGVDRIFVIWGDDGVPTGAVATRLHTRNDTTRVGEIYWLAGHRLSSWLHLIPEIEQVLVRDYGIVEMEATCRRGFERATKPIGYRRAKVILVKRLENGIR